MSYVGLHHDNFIVQEMSYIPRFHSISSDPTFMECRSHDVQCTVYTVRECIRLADFLSGGSAIFERSVQSVTGAGDNFPIAARCY